MRTIVCLSLVYLLLAAPALAAEKEDLAAATKLATVQNYFAADIFARLRSQEGNIFFSPYSIHTAMSMTYVGASGETAKALSVGLCLGNLVPPNAKAGELAPLVLADFAAQHRLFNESHKDGLELHAANALWGKPGYPFNKDYIKSIKDSFDGDLKPLDFKDEAAARKTINDWVAGATKDKIKDLIGQGLLKPETRLVLTNAIYFKAAWADQFRKENTTREKFHRWSDKDLQAMDVDVDMMKQTIYYKLAKLDGFRMIQIPYKGNQASMLVLLPDKVDGLAELEKSLTAQKLSDWVEKLKETRVALQFPRFKNTCQFRLDNTLRGLGMELALSGTKADFTGIANVPDEPLFIGAVVQKAFVDVNEEGTEAAAATAVAIKTAIAPAPEADPEKFIADHPFIYLIRDNRTGDILFMGRLADPTKAE